MRIKTITATAAVLLASAVGAQQVANPAPQAVQLGSYAVEPSHTRVLFSLSHFGFSTWYGDFTQASGTLTLDPMSLATTSLKVSLPIASVSTTNAKLDEELKSPDWLDAPRFPTATFISTRVTSTGARTADVAGNLTFHGVTKPLTLHVSFNGAGVNPMDKSYNAGFEARGSFSRSAYGVTKFVPLVGDEVKLIISGAFVKKA